MKSKLNENILLESNLRRQINIFIEPILIKACETQAIKIGCKTRSKFIRYSIINNLLLLNYPLVNISEKYKPFLEKFNKQIKSIT